jgi:autotransporter translocation and assembly factor TamB
MVHGQRRMKALRRLLQVLALVGTLCVGILAMALIVSQTPWFRDWLRRYIVRESKQYLNGELAIGGIGGNLFFGVNLSDVAVDVSGERVIAVKAMEVDYSVFQLISKGIVLDGIKISQPLIVVERDAQGGWNLARLVKKQEREADRRGPTRPISLESIEIADASVSIRDRLAGDGYQLPREISNLDFKGGFAYEPVHYTVDVGSLSFLGASPRFDLQEFSGRIAVRDDNLYFEKLAMRTAESSLTVDGVVEHYLGARTLKLTTTGTVSMPEIGRVVPGAAGYALHPAVKINANGPAERLQLDLDVRSEAGNVRGNVLADVTAPDFAFKGDVDTERLNLAPILKDPAQRSSITGHGTIDIRIAGRPAGARLTDRITGTYRFTGPHVLAAGYEARNVRATGRLDGPRITLDARADGYGGTGTARGFIVTPGRGRAVAYDLRGSANNVDLRNLPVSTGAPKLSTNLSVAQYHVRGEGRTVTGSATLNRSTVEGATIGDGTVATFEVTPAAVSYTAKGQTADLNLQRVGTALNVAALAKPEYDSRINGEFTVSGTVDRAGATARRRDPAPSSTLATMKLDATGTLTDSTLWGGTLPRLAFETHVDRGALDVRADGEFDGFNPARLTGRKELEGRVTGTVAGRVVIADITGPIAPEDVTTEGKLALTKSVVGGLTIDEADIDGKFASRVGDITRVHVAGPDVKADAAGRIALDRSGQSNLKYHVEAINLTELAKLAGRSDIGGSAVLDGTITGNAASLATTGTVNGSNLAYEKNRALDVNSEYQVTVPDLQFANANVKARTTATFLTVGGVDIAEVTASTTYDRQRLEFTTNVREQRRTMDATGLLILHPDHSEVHLPRFSVRTQGIEWQSAPGSEAVVQYGRGRLELQNVRLVSADQALNVDGALALGGNATAGTLRVQARNVDLQQLETLLLQNRGFTGRLTADATIGGSTAEPVVDGRIEVAAGGFKTYKYESLAADLKYAGTRLQLDARLQQSPTEFLTARGSVPRTLFEKGEGGHVAPAGEDQIDLQITSSQVGLGFVQGFTDVVADVTGTVQADVHVTGSGRDPHVNGYVNVENGAFTVPLGGVSYTGLNTRIDLDTDRVQLTKFTILDEHGKPMSISGDLAVHERQVGAINVSVQSRDFELIDNPLGDVGVDADLKITGELRRPRVEGEIRLEDARLEVHRILELFYDPYAVEAMPDVISAERTIEGAGSAKEATADALRRAQTSAAPPEQSRAPQEAPAAPGGAFAPVELNVRLRIPDNLVLRGRDLRPSGPTGTAMGDMNVTVGGDVQVRKSPGGQVVLVGNVQTIRGFYDFQGRRFDLVRGGQIRFIGTPEINPAIDVTATRVIPNTGVEARVRITGTARTPELALSSNPPLEESDILSLIVFNRPVNELGTGERSSLAATAGGIASGFLAAPLGESIGKALDLDLFEITTSTEEGDLGAGVMLGQQVGDRAFVKLRQQFGERNISEFLIEYQLTDFLRLQASAAPETSGSGNRLNQRRVERGGIDLIFFFSY